ncbi:MAG: KAP family NTPase [Ruminococcus bromii]|nr:KAP family NTPase [Ruminococcus bromii]
MKKIELQPTKENIYKTFIDDSIGRNKDICYFISLLDSFDENNSIAINSNWGSGKTFFVKQIEMVLGIHNKFFQTAFEDSEKNVIILQYSNLCKRLNVDEIEKLYLPIYYDAWKYDNDDDPILSIVYEIISTLNNKYDFEELNINFSKILKGIMEALNLSGMYDLIASIKVDDDLKNIAKSRDLKSKIDEFLDQIPIERADKVVIFIDELDRCKPTYAVKLLERIKHYFNNDKIIFVFSTNLEELQSSVKCVYGESFNAYRYLDRFFDLKIPLPKADMSKYFSSIEFDKNNYVFDGVCHKFMEKYNFQLRDISKYARYLKMTTYNSAHNGGSAYYPDEVGYLFCLQCLTPIIVGLFVYDITLYNNFINGYDSSPLIELLADGEIGKFFFKSMLANGETYDDHTLVTRESKLNELYDAIFNTNYDNGIYEKTIGTICIEKDTKEYLLNIINLLSNEAHKSWKVDDE